MESFATIVHGWKTLIIAAKLSILDIAGSGYASELEFLQIKELGDVLLINGKSNFINPLARFSPVSHLYTPWKRQKTFGFLTFSEGIEMWHWTKMG